MMTAIHCDDLIDDPAQPDCLRQWLRYNRLPAACKLPGRSGDMLAQLTEFVSEEQRPFIWTDPEPVLFATVKIDRARASKTIPSGTRVRVVMASRFGDVGITSNLKAKHGYDMRVLVTDLADFGVAP